VDIRSAATGRVKKVWLSRVTFAIVLPVLGDSQITEDAKNSGKNDSGEYLADKAERLRACGHGTREIYLRTQTGRARP
jgi:hypothetical protein